MWGAMAAPAAPAPTALHTTISPLNPICLKIAVPKDTNKCPHLCKFQIDRQCSCRLMTSQNVDYLGVF